MSSVQLLSYQDRMLANFTRWLSSERDCFEWSGGTVQFPPRENYLQEFTVATPSGRNAFAICSSRSGEHIGHVDLNSADAGERVHLCRLLISPNWRRQGAGDASLKRLLEIVATQSQVRTVSLNVFSHNVGAIALYKRHGFTVAALHNTFFQGETWMTLRMVKRQA